MKVMAQISMIMNLDKCIGCHTWARTPESGHGDLIKMR